MKAALAVLGTASDVGKSLIAAGLCRLLTADGLDVAPFKAQNMATQAGVTADGLEMPRAQILQARACRQAPHVDMGPVLLKPVSATRAQVVVLGRASGIEEARAYFADTRRLAGIAHAALERLAARHDVIVLEGAGSPVELNLAERDFANLAPARLVGAALILVADIDRGGVFAQVKGTLDLLPPDDRRRVVGVIVNRFRGDRALFDGGVTRLEELTGVPVLAVVPHVDHGLDEEDRPFRIPLDERAPEGTLSVGAVLSPRVSNTEDLAPLLAEPDVHLTWLTDPRLVREQHLLILPGSKATVGDLVHHASTGMADAILVAHEAGTWVLGLCGGYQMLGAELHDIGGTEGGPPCWPGLGLLPIRTIFEATKQTLLSRYESRWPLRGCELSGYEIHHGRSEAVSSDGEPLTSARETRGGSSMEADDGPRAPGAEVGWRRGRAVGAYLHGLLTSDAWRSAFLNEVRRDHGLAEHPIHVAEPIDSRLDRWAEHLRRSLRPGAWDRILHAAGNA